MFIQFFSTKSYLKDIIIKDDEHGFITGSFFLNYMPLNHIHVQRSALDIKSFVFN